MLTIRCKALAKQERYRKSRLRKYSRGWRLLLAEHFVARLLCRLATIVFQYEQPERRLEITVLAVRIDTTDNADNLTWRSLAISLSAFQNSSSILTLVLRPARKIERLTTGDFIGPRLHNADSPCPAPNGIGQYGPMADYTHNIDRWDEATGENLIERIAGVSDYQVAVETYKAAVRRWPGAKITLRNRARVIEQSWKD